MKRISLISSTLIALLSSNYLFSQVGIGTSTPDASSILHLNSSNKGLLLTSVALTSTTDASTISSPAIGLLVWNNGNGGLAPVGLYYWNNSQWNILSAGGGGGSSNGWNTTGTNIGTYSGSSTSLALGTSTYDDLIFKINSSIAGRLGVNNSVALGTSSTAAQNATAIGNGANAAYQATAIGYNAKVTSNDATAIGENSEAAGYQSIAIGYNSKTNSSGETAIGINSITNNQNSTAIGNQSSATGQNSTAIGYGASTSQSNAIVLGNNNANVGIGTSTPNTSAKLDVNGQYKLGEKGTLQKNLISFDVYPSISINNLGAGQTTTLSITIPAGLLSSTKATITVTPDGNFLGKLLLCLMQELILQQML